MKRLNRQSQLHQCVERLIETESGTHSRIISSGSVSGGCINATEIVTLDDQRRFFVKSQPGSQEPFVAEAAGLAAIRSTGAIRVPDLIGVGQTESGDGFLVLEAIEGGPRRVDFFEIFGTALALMHQHGLSDRFGFDHNNFLGRSFQPNAWTTDWVEFWAEHRLGFQLKLAHQNGYATPELTRLTDGLIKRLGEFIGAKDAIEGSLIHGDLWSGNFLVSSEGDPVLIDPAVYYAPREVEFGMTTLFGGFDSSFYHAYNETWPLHDDWEERVEIYKLYHLMNHLNLFGTGYLADCLSVLAKFR